MNKLGLLAFGIGLLLSFGIAYHFSAPRSDHPANLTATISGQAVQNHTLSPATSVKKLPDPSALIASSLACSDCTQAFQKYSPALGNLSNFEKEFQVNLSLPFAENAQRQEGYALIYYESNGTQTLTNASQEFLSAADAFVKQGENFSRIRTRNVSFTVAYTEQFSYAKAYFGKVKAGCKAVTCAPTQMIAQVSFYLQDNSVVLVLDRYHGIGPGGGDHPLALNNSLTVTSI